MQQVWPSSGGPAIDTRKILVWISYGCALCHLFRCMFAKPRFCSCSVCRDTGVASRLRSTGPLAGASVALHCMGTTLLHLARPFYAKSTWENVRRGGEEGSRWDGHGIYLEGDDGWAWTRCKGAWQASLDILGHSFGDVRSGFHGGFPWWVSMVGFHGGFPWWVSMVGWCWCWGGRRLCFRPRFHVLSSFFCLGGLVCTARIGRGWIRGGVGGVVGLLCVEGMNLCRLGFGIVMGFAGVREFAGAAGSVGFWVVGVRGSGFVCGRCFGREVKGMARVQRGDGRLNEASRGSGRVRWPGWERLGMRFLMKMSRTCTT